MSSNASYGKTASEYIDREGGWTAFLRNFILGGIVLSGQYEVIDGIQSTGGLILGPVRALGNGMIALVDATIGNVIAVFDAGTQATVLSFTDGVAALLGPLAQPVSVGVAMISLGVFMWMINYLEISPFSFIASLRN